MRSGSQVRASGSRSAILIILLVSFALSLSGCGPAPTGFEYVGYGANRRVSGALHVIAAGSDSVILDAGSFYGDDGRGVPSVPAEIVELASAVVLTHAHADHVGRLINLSKAGYKGPIYLTEPTKELMRVMLPMSARFGDMGTETVSVK